MARETQKEKIERLEKELNNANSIIQKLNSEISEMIDKEDNSFENSSTYRQMEKHIRTLEIKIKAITNTAEHNRKMYEHELRINEELYMKSKGNDIDLLQENFDKWHKEYLNKKQEYENLQEDYKKTEKENQKLINEINKLKIKNSNNKIYNERGAGRKQEIMDIERDEIRKYRAEGKTIKEIAKIFNRSVGIIHKIINEKTK